MAGVEFRRDLAIGDSLGDPQLVWGAGDADNFSVAL